MHGNETATPIAGSSTEMSQSAWTFSQKSEFVEADTTGVQSPTVTWDASGHDWSMHVIELNEAAAGGAYPLEIQEFNRFKNRQPKLGM